MQADPLAGPGVGQGAGGFGANAPTAGTSAADGDFEVVDIETGTSDASATVDKKSAKKAAKGDKQAVAEREKELNKKEKELNKKERDLERRDSQADPLRVNNWPPCYPVLHHDIRKDIPEGKRNITRMCAPCALLECLAAGCSRLCESKHLASDFDG